MGVGARADRRSGPLPPGGAPGVRHLGLLGVDIHILGDWMNVRLHGTKIQLLTITLRRLALT